MTKSTKAETKEKDRKKIRNMSELSRKEQVWLAKAVISVILADDVVEDLEVEFIKKISKVFRKEEPPKTLRKISQSLREKKMPEIEEFEVEDPEHIIFMLNLLVSSVFANERKDETEVKKYFEAGLKLGMTHEVLIWKLNYQKERFRIKMAQRKIDDDIREIVKNRKKKQTLVKSQNQREENVDA